MMLERTGRISWSRGGPFQHETYYGDTPGGTCYRVEWRHGSWVACWWYDTDGDLLRSSPVDLGSYRDPRSAMLACAAREG